MGCAISGLAAKSDFGERGMDDAPAHLSDAQIQMIKDSWKVIRDDIAKVGIIMFVRYVMYLHLRKGRVTGYADRGKSYKTGSSDSWGKAALCIKRKRGPLTSHLKKNFVPPPPFILHLHVATM